MIYTGRMNISYPFVSLLLGLLMAQILATVQVYLSNTALYESLLAISEAGYLPVPNQHVSNQLLDFGPAFKGGLFFTFSIGAGISFFSLAAAWLWNRLFGCKKNMLYLFLLLWIACLLAVNFYGFKVIVTLYFLLIPPAVFATASACMIRDKKQRRQSREIIHIVPVIMLAIILLSQINNRLFTDFRDIFLFSNRVGVKINNFYYKYTLFPAEVFKSLNQKLLKTCRIEKLEPAETRVLEMVLLKYDYIPIAPNNEVDLTIVAIDDGLYLKNQGRTIVQVDSKEFFTNPAKWIRQFEEKSDIYPVFRQLTFLSLLIGLPLAIYVIGHGLITFVLGIFFIKSGFSSVIASGICFLLCLFLFASFHFNRSTDKSADNLPNMLNSDRWQTRVAALKIIDEKGLEIKKIQAYRRLLTSPHTAERYWMARVLAHSKSPETYQDLLRFLDDPHPNVVSMALYALGKRGNRQAIYRIKRVIESSDNWYNQGYAYRALRTLGWRQRKLN